jgi:hypothetical protein
LSAIVEEARWVEDPLTAAVVVAERGRSNLQNRLSAFRTIPEFLSSLDAIIELLDER